MADPGLLDRIEVLRSDFASVRGEPFKHFYCPILMRDEPTELCRGHIVNDAFGTCNEWVPQRKDVDNFFGSAVEADLITIIRDRGKHPFEILRDAKPGNKLRPRLLIRDKEKGYYFPEPTSPVAAGHASVQVIDEEDNPIRNLTVKCSRDEILATADGDISILIDADFRYAAIASMIKAAHLTLFKLFGYEHVFSYVGTYLADILRRFYESHKPPEKCRQVDVEKHFRPFETMIVPLERLGDNLKGTLTDNSAIFHFGQSGKVFAIGVIVKAGLESFCIFVPGMGECIDTYFGFLREPPPYVHIKIAQYRPGNGKDQGCWAIPDGEPIRVVMHAPESESSEAEPA